MHGRYLVGVKTCTVFTMSSRERERKAYFIPRNIPRDDIVNIVLVVEKKNKTFFDEYAKRVRVYIHIIII